MSKAWMPLFIGDYVKDTGHLSTLEHGAYLLLIMHYWQRGELPTEDAKLARIAKLSAKDWASVGPTLAGLFLPGWKHKRVEEELVKADKKSKAAQASAGKRWKWDANAMPTHMPTQSEGICGSHAITITEINNIHSRDTAREPKEFPPDGSITFTEPFASIARRKKPGVDVDMLAAAFRSFCRGADIDLGDPLIARKFETFCAKHKFSGLAA